MSRSFFFLIGLIFSILFSHCSKYENSSNYGMKTKTTYSSESSISPANTLATLDGNIYSPSSYEYYIKNIARYCINSEASISDIVYTAQKSIENIHGVKPSLMIILQGLNTAVTSDEGRIYDLKEVAAMFVTIY